MISFQVTRVMYTLRIENNENNMVIILLRIRQQILVALSVFKKILSHIVDVYTYTIR